MVVASVGAQDGSRDLGPRPARSIVAAALRRSLRRNNAGKSSLAPEKFWPNAAGNLSIIRLCAGGSAWTDWGRPCAFFSRDLLCPAWKRPASAAHPHRLVLDPTEPDQLAFGCAQA